MMTNAEKIKDIFCDGGEHILVRKDVISEKEVKFLKSGSRKAHRTSTEMA